MENTTIVFYDGDCGFCNKTIEFILRTESSKILYFSSLQSKYAQDLFRKEKITIQLDTLYFKEGKSLYSKSSAFFKIANYLKNPYSLFKYLSPIVPRFISDSCYDLVSRNRLKIVKNYVCSIPSPEDLKRFTTK